MIDLDPSPKHWDLIYDVGMHRGEDSSFYLQKGFRVVGFEADPALARHCRSRFDEFIRAGRLTIVEGAIVTPERIASGARTVRFYHNDEVSVWGTIDVNWAERNEKQGAPSHVVEVAAIDFAQVLRQYGIPHFMKVDIEGLDMVCVNALHAFRERPDYISVESNKTAFANIKREIEVLCALGYDSFQAVEQSAVADSQTPPNPAREGAYFAHRFEKGSSGLFGRELGGAWTSAPEVLKRYRWISLGYNLVGDSGLVSGWKFRGAWRVQAAVSRVIGWFTKATVPGWFDTHARHASAADVDSVAPAPSQIGGNA